MHLSKNLTIKKVFKCTDLEIYLDFYYILKKIGKLGMLFHKNSVSGYEC